MGIAFKIRASGAGEIIARAGLTDKQQSRLIELQTRKDRVGKALTPNMEIELAGLIFKKEHPELPEGAKTYCEKWLNQTIWNRRKDIKSKYIDKGNLSEEDGFTLMATELDLGMVYKNERFFEDEHFCGTPDLIKWDTVYDNKCSWDLDSFPMYKSEHPNPAYWWQLQVYMAMTGCRKAVLAYTLIDADPVLIAQAVRFETDPEKIYQTLVNMLYTKDAFESARSEFCPLAKSDYFIEIPENKRIKTFSFDYDEKSIAFLRERVGGCQLYINSLI